MIAYLCEQDVPLCPAEILFDSFDNVLDNLDHFSVLRSETGTYTGFCPGGGVILFDILVGGPQLQLEAENPWKK